MQTVSLETAKLFKVSGHLAFADHTRAIDIILLESRIIVLFWYINRRILAKLMQTVLDEQSDLFLVQKSVPILVILAPNGIDRLVDQVLVKVGARAHGVWLNEKEERWVRK